MTITVLILSALSLLMIGLLTYPSSRQAGLVGRAGARHRRRLAPRTEARPVMVSETRQIPYWFADTDDEEGVAPFVWQPCLETNTGHVPCLNVWCDSKEACEDWIRVYVLGATFEPAEEDA